MGDRKSTIGPAAWSQILRIYDHAVALSPAEREAYLRQAAADAPDVRSVVERLLARATRVEAFLEEPIAAKMAELPLSALVGNLPSGTRIADFEIGALLGEGGIAKVFLAQDLSLGRQVALKVSPDPGGEARAIARIEHEHVVQVFSQRTEGALHFIAMQFVPGVDLEKLRTHLVAEKITPNGKAILEWVAKASAHHPSEAAAETTSRLERLDYIGAIVWIGACVADGLDAAHRTGVLHSDIKPGNILLHRTGKPYVSDFNVSLSSAALRSGDAGRIGGTLRYMAPEHRALFELPSEERRAHAMRLDETIDVYGLGCVLQELLELSRTPLPDSVAIVLRKACAMAPRERFSAAEFRDRLNGCLELHLAETQLPASRFGDGYRLLERLQRGWAVAQLLAMAAAVAATAGLAGKLDSVVLGAGVVVGGLALVFTTRAWFRLLAFLRLGIASSETKAPDAPLAADLRRAALALPRKALVVGPVPVMAAYLAMMQASLLLGRFAGERWMASLGFHIVAIGLFAGACLSLWSARLAVAELYRRLWFGEPRVRERAASELHHVGARPAWALAVAVIAPVAFAFAYFDGARGPGYVRTGELFGKVALFVGKLYSDVLHRSPTPAEAESLRAIVADRGAPKADDVTCIVYGFLHTDEALRARVAGWHRTLFRRQESIGYLVENEPALAPWVQRLAAGEPELEVLGAMILKNREDIAGAWGDGEFAAVLPRALGIAGALDATDRALASTTDAEQVGRLLRSEAFAVARVQSLYPRFLRRPLQEAERTSVFSRYWSDELARHQDEAAIVAGFLSSEEYTGIPLGALNGFPNTERCGHVRRFGVLAAALLPLPLPVSLSLAFLWLAIAVGLGIAAMRASSRTLGAFVNIAMR